MFKTKIYLFAVFATLVVLSITAPALAGQMEDTIFPVPEPIVDIDSSENYIDISVEQS